VYTSSSHSNAGNGPRAVISGQEFFEKTLTNHVAIHAAGKIAI